jgi:hypothetical protein
LVRDAYKVLIRKINGKDHFRDAGYVRMKTVSWILERVDLDDVDLIYVAYYRDRCLIVVNIVGILCVP